MKRMTKKTAVLSVTLLIAVMVAAGCGASEKLVEEAMEEATGVEVDQDGDSVTVSTDDGEMTITGEASELPEGFPLEAYPGAKIESSMTTGQEGAKNFVVSLSSKDAIPEIAAFYEEALQAMGITPEKMELADDASTSVFLNAKTTDLDISVQIYDGESVGMEGNVMNLIVAETKTN